MEQRIIDLHDDYTHGRLDRREFMERLTSMAGSAAAALALLPFLQNNYAKAQIVPNDDNRLAISYVNYEAGGANMGGYLARLKGGVKRPAVIVIHENRGLNPHIQDVTRRMAVEGFLAFAPDSLAPLGGTPLDESQAGKMLGSIAMADHVIRLAAGVPVIAKHAESTGKVGVVGFCWGGAMTNRLSAAGTSLNAAVPYYGMQLPIEEIPKITAPLLFHYAENDERINAGIQAYEAALKANNKIFTSYMYKGTQHAFNNDTNAARYNREAAELAWGRTVAFFKKHLGG